ncbi:hypothetical protein E2C01_057096 [Portunus trituberculatus]|uniref:Uncharacterized protein n=1 Tax=Portunus trituberculatus TaxID=210409 RepID=A0A5B7GZ44_PORTR|nr:hypothetical protein [Portunus trituberculatus]
MSPSLPPFTLPHPLSSPFASLSLPLFLPHPHHSGSQRLHPCQLLFPPRPSFPFLHIALTFLPLPPVLFPSLPSPSHSPAPFQTGRCSIPPPPPSSLPACLLPSPPRLLSTLAHPIPHSSAPIPLFLLLRLTKSQEFKMRVILGKCINEVDLRCVCVCVNGILKTLLRRASITSKRLKLKLRGGALLRTRLIISVAFENSCGGKSKEFQSKG